MVPRQTRVVSVCPLPMAVFAAAPAAAPDAVPDFLGMGGFATHASLLNRACEAGPLSGVLVCRTSTMIGQFRLQSWSREARGKYSIDGSCTAGLLTAVTKWLAVPKMYPGSRFEAPRPGRNGLCLCQYRTCEKHMGSSQYLWNAVPVRTTMPNHYTPYGSHVGEGRPEPCTRQNLPLILLVLASANLNVGTSRGVCRSSS